MNARDVETKVAEVAREMTLIERVDAAERGLEALKERTHELEKADEESRQKILDLEAQVFGLNAARR